MTMTRKYDGAHNNSITLFVHSLTFPCFFMFHMHFHKSPISQNQSKPNLAITLSILTFEEKLNSKVFHCYVTTWCQDNK